MASSSHKTHKIQNPLEEVISDLEKEERSTDWLELGLGLGLGFSNNGYKKHQKDEKSHPVSVGSSPLASQPSPFVIHRQNHLHQQIEVGFGSGLDYKGVRPSSNNHNMLLQDLHHHQDYEHDLPLFQWQMHMFNDSNDYSTSRRPHPGFWFTLISTHR